jgi:hypothetical protein
MKKVSQNYNPRFASVISRSKDLFKIKLKSIFIPAFVLAAITQLIGIYLNTMLSVSADGTHINNPIGMSFLIFAMIIVRCLISGIIMVILYDSVIAPDFTKVLSYVTRLLPSLILNYIIFVILVGVGLMIYVIPGLILLTFFTLYEQIILFEQEKGIRSLSQSFSRIKNIFFATFTIVIFCLVIRYAPIYLLQSLGEQLSSPSLFGIDQAIEIFINTITIAFVASIYVTLYDEIKNSHKIKTKNLSKPKNKPKTRSKKT